MQLKNEHHTFTGMQRDSSVARHPSSFLYDGYNIRLTAREGDTLYSITNEKGTKETDISVEGTYLGHCLLNKYLIVFSTDSESNEPDYINMINLEAFTKTLLYNGNLKFSIEYPIEAIGSYENKDIQKVYWTDGYNQPRMINIMSDTSKFNDSYFDFIRDLALNEKVSIQKLLGSGRFAPGVIQYALTYYTKYGQESNIFYTSPLLYISFKDRGASPEDVVENAFKIKVDNIDSNFDYLRIYSIQRTSFNGTPIAKRVQDIEIGDAESISFTDTGDLGDSIDPTELLYKGGESIKVKTIEQKDNTLFLGNLTLNREPLRLTSDAIQNIHIIQGTRNFIPTIMSNVSYNTGYVYGNQLTSVDEEGNSVPCGGFKRGDYYRCGVQFQHKSGRWCDPIFIKDEPVTNKPGEITENNSYYIQVPILKGVLTKSFINTYIPDEYIKARAVVVYPSIRDRMTLCQGVTCPTLFTSNHREGTEDNPGNNDLYAQSSWFFRPSLFLIRDGGISSIGTVIPQQNDDGELYYQYNGNKDSPEHLRATEIQGHYESGNVFNVDYKFSTLHSPDIEFDEQLWTINWLGTSYRKVGDINFETTFSDINIQTETPVAGSKGGGFVHRSFIDIGAYGIVSGLFYDDTILDYDNGKIQNWIGQHDSSKWLVYPWQKTGSLNNDTNRPSDLGTQTSLLKKKVISNLRHAKTIYSDGTINSYELSIPPEVFSSNDVNIIKLGNKVYQGNVDTMLTPDEKDGVYFANSMEDETSFEESDSWWKTSGVYSDGQYINKGLYEWEEDDNDNNNSSWNYKRQVGDSYEDLVLFKGSVRMKYKSTPHLVIDTGDNSIKSTPDIDLPFGMPIVEIFRTSRPTNIFGGETDDALKANVWIPCGEPVRLDNLEDVEIDGETVEAVVFNYSWGDTYYQRWDCLKTYPFTPEDINQVVEIGSFMLETRVNIDGRYDRNRGQLNNLNMTPQNFNLLNPVYSQVNNFFTYRILDDDYYNISSFPNQITWSKEKQAGASVDLWTNVTLGSTYDMDGSKGEITSLNTWKDQIFCFQNKGVSNILFNSRVQIPTSDGVPIEITNSYKVDGYRYIADGIGCNDKFQIKETPSGIYFIDSVTNHLFNIGSSLADVTSTHNMSSWFTDNMVNKLLYDDINHDLYLINNDIALCFSEVLGQFTSFMDYGGISLIETYNKKVATIKDSALYKMFEGQYNNFFGTENEPNFRPWYFTFISNGVDNSFMDFDKIFTNIDYRMDMNDESGYKHNSSLDYIRVTDEYQDTGICNLKMFTTVNNSLRRYPLKDKNLQKKFREWRIQIPRNQGTLDRIRNPWCKITLGSNSSTNYQAVLHDLNVQYYM